MANKPNMKYDNLKSINILQICTLINFICTLINFIEAQQSNQSYVTYKLQAPSIVKKMIINRIDREKERNKKREISSESYPWQGCDKFISIIQQQQLLLQLDTPTSSSFMAFGCRRQ